MKKTILFCLALFTTALLNAQKKEARSPGTFEAISIAIPANVHITRGQGHKVVLEGDSDDLKNIKTEIERGTLKVGSEGNQWWGGSRLKSRITIYITTPELTGVNLAGSGSLQSKDKFTAEEFNANVSGSGKMDLHIDADNIDINISGSGEVKLAGNSKKADIDISGSGDVEAEALRITEADINILGSGSCRLHVREKISSTIMGSGKVYFAGDPKHVNNNSMGSGRIKKL